VHVEIERDSNDVEIAGALAIAKERAFHAVRAREQASSDAATPVNRSLCVWRLMMSESRFLMLRQIHSIWSAYTFGIATSTVSGRFKIIFRCGVGLPHVHDGFEISFANSTSVALKLSGEYWSATSAPFEPVQTLLDQLRAAHGDGP